MTPRDKHYHTTSRKGDAQLAQRWSLLPTVFVCLIALLVLGACAKVKVVENSRGMFRHRIYCDTFLYVAIPKENVAQGVDDATSREVSSLLWKTLLTRYPNTHLAAGPQTNKAAFESAMHYTYVVRPTILSWTNDTQGINVERSKLQVRVDFIDVYSKEVARSFLAEALPRMISIKNSTAYLEKPFQTILQILSR